MRSRALAGTLLVAGFLVTAIGASSVGAIGPARQWAIVYLHQPTLIGSTIVEGPVLFVHDEARMARGEPCTSVRLVEPATGPTEEIASFHCIPIRRPLAHAFTITTRANDALGIGCVLVEYQFAGDTEGHGVPAPAYAH